MTTGTDQVPESAPATPSRPTFVPSKSFAGSLSISILLLWVLILAYIGFFSTYSLQRHATFNTFAADLSYIDQPMWNTLQGRFLERTLDDRQAPRLAEHFEPILVPIALVFYLWDDVRAILIIQTAALALGALPVYWIARQQISHLQSPWLPLVFAFIYLMFPALQAANVADFHADPFVVAPLLFAFWYATQGQYRAMWAWSLVAMLVKENLPTLTFMLGSYLLFSRGSAIPDPPFPAPPLTRRRLHGLALMGVSLAWFYVATFLIVAPLARQVYGTDGPIYLVSRYSDFSGGRSGLVARLADTLALLREPDRLVYLAGLLAPVGWLALLAPEYLLLGLPVLAANIFSNFPGQYSGEQHYSAPLVPVFVIAAIYGVRRLGIGATMLRRYGAVVLVAWLLAWSLGYHYLRGWTPLAREFDWPERTPHHQLLARFIDQIPPGVPLSTTPPLHPHLAHREKIYVFPTVADAGFVLVDVSGRTDAHPNDVQATLTDLIGSGKYGVVDAADGYILLSREYTAGTGGSLPGAFYDFARAPDAQPQYPAQVTFGNRLRFLGYDLIDDPRWRQTYLRLYWQALAPLDQDLVLWPFIFSDDGALIEDTSQRPMVAPLWYPPSRWRVGEVVVTEMLPWDLGPRFNAGVAALSGAPGRDSAGLFTDPAARLAVTSAGPGVTLFHASSWAQVGAFARDGRYLVPLTGEVETSPLQVAFAETIRLAGYHVSQRPSQVSVVLRWEAAATIARDYTVFVHLVAPDGRGVSQSDARPNWVAPYPTDRWLPGEMVLDGHQLAIPADASPGRYRLQVGLYDWQTMERLPILDETLQPVGDYAVLQELTIGR